MTSLEQQLIDATAANDDARAAALVTEIARAPSGLTLGEKRIQIYENVALGHVVAGRWETAEPICNEISKLNSNSAAPACIRAMHLIQQGQIPKAVETLEAGLKTDPDHAGAIATLAACHLFLGNKAQTKRVLKSGVERQPALKAAILEETMLSPLHRWAEANL